MTISRNAKFIFCEKLKQRSYILNKTANCTNTHEFIRVISAIAQFLFLYDGLQEHMDGHHVKLNKRQGNNHLLLICKSVVHPSGMYGFGNLIYRN